MGGRYRKHLQRSSTAKASTATLLLSSTKVLEMYPIIMIYVLPVRCVTCLTWTCRTPRRWELQAESHGFQSYSARVYSASLWVQSSSYSAAAAKKSDAMKFP